jgi:hypothetical protein
MVGVEGLGKVGRNDSFIDHLFLFIADTSSLIQEPWNDGSGGEEK